MNQLIMMNKQTAMTMNKEQLLVRWTKKLHWRWIKNQDKENETQVVCSLTGKTHATHPIPTPKESRKNQDVEHRKPHTQKKLFDSIRDRSMEPPGSVVSLRSTIGIGGKRPARGASIWLLMSVWMSSIEARGDERSSNDPGVGLVSLVV